MSSLAAELNTAIHAVHEAARCCEAVGARLDSGVLEKNDHSPVTIADFASQALVCRRLAECFPDDSVIAEENADTIRRPEHRDLLRQVVELYGETRDETVSSDEVCDWIDRGGSRAYRPRFWTLDPIDGTKGFLRRQNYAVALALIVDGQAVVAALACPRLVIEDGDDVGQVLAAIAPPTGRARAWRAPLRSCPDRADAMLDTAVSLTTEWAAFRFCESVESQHSSRETSAQLAERLGITATPVRIDSQAKYALVAAGGADAYLRVPTRAGYVEKIWDHAPGAMIVAAAGGKVTDLDGKSLDYSHGAELASSRGVVATNGRRHDELIAALAAL